MEQYLKVLWSYNDRCRLSPELSDYLRGAATSIILPQDEILQQEGELRDDLLFIEKGILRYFLSDEGSVYTHDFRFENQFVKTLKQYRPDFGGTEYGISTLTEVRLWAFSADTVQYACENFPEFNHPFSVIYVSDLRDSRRMTEAYHRKFTPKQHYQLLLQRSRNQARQIPHPVLADFIGVTPEEFEASLNSPRSLKVPYKKPVNNRSARRLP